MKIGFIGIGNMGGAILRGYFKAGEMDSGNVFIFDSNEEKIADMERDLNVIGCKSIQEVASRAEVIIIGVKPNGFEEVLPEVAAQVNRSGQNKTIVSMAAGISISFIEKYFNPGVKVIRIMPNTPAMVNEAMVAVCRNHRVTDNEFAEMFHIFESMGRAEEVDEDLMHCVIGVSGSSPAYTYMYIDALANSAVKNGMGKEQAIIFAAQAVLGAAKMVLETGIDPIQLRINVCSPGGTTIEAVNKLKENGFEKNIQEGFQAAVEKSKTMVKI